MGGEGVTFGGKSGSLSQLGGGGLSQQVSGGRFFRNPFFVSTDSETAKQEVAKQTLPLYTEARKIFTEAMVGHIKRKFRNDV